jgi:hypothetical protein
VSVLSPPMSTNLRKCKDNIQPTALFGGLRTWGKRSLFVTSSLNESLRTRNPLSSRKHRPGSLTNLTFRLLFEFLKPKSRSWISKRTRSSLRFEKSNREEVNSSFVTIRFSTPNI